MQTHSRSKPGFALIVTLSLMILLAVIAVGLLTLSSISLRNSSNLEKQHVARANARLAIILAIGELQKSVGDDRRITADGSIYENAAHPHAVGVWKSWSPRRIENPEGTAPNYTVPKSDSGFISWLVSSNDPDSLKAANWARAGALGDPINLFATKQDGFNLAGSKIAVMKNTATPGTFAWAVSQSATKAKVNVAGPEDNRLVANDNLQAQPRPSLGLGDTFKNPADGWDLRASRVISMSQTKLDNALWNSSAAVEGYSNYTTQGFGILADVVNGGLKTDLSLGFELPDVEFDRDQWSGVNNPFRYASAPALGAFPSYRGERPLFRPTNPNGTIEANLAFAPANVHFAFPSAAVPTFNTLRSFYRTPHHLYNTAGGPTLFERGLDHVALTQGSVGANQFPPPSATPPALTTRTGYRPILDRVMFVLSASIHTDNQPRLVVTPIITLWNPYNVGLEIEGAVAYPWIDWPFVMDWEFNSSAGTPAGTRRVWMSDMLGEQFRLQNNGRSVNPYFYAAITSDGQPLGPAPRPIRLQPGEVRVFAPTSPTIINFTPTDSIRNRTVFLRPVDNPNQLSARGGISLPMYNPLPANTNKRGFQRAMEQGETVRATFASVGGSFPFYMSLEDATRARGADPDHSARGQVLGDVQTGNLPNDGTLATRGRTPFLSYNQIRTEPYPFAVLETYHRTARDTPSSQRADLVFTTNPRQPYMNPYLAQGNFKTGPHYETKLRGINSLSEVIQSENGRSYYGASNASNTGRTHLSFFEVPRAPLLSLAAFQHADLSATAFSTANQFGNSWASAYLSRAQTAKLTSANGVNNLPVFDHSFLANEALWDSFFFSGAAPDLQPGSSGGSSAVWNTSIATVTRSLEDTIRGFVEDPAASPLRNPRFRLHRGGLENAELVNTLTQPAGCTEIAAHLLVDGAFNINSTHVDAWAAFIGGLRGKSFDVTGGNPPSGDSTGFPRFRNPVGTENDNWQGFRSLTDTQIKTLAANIVKEVRLRGPFLSLGEFVNRRVEDSALGLKGALQSAIDSSNLNAGALIQAFDTANYPSEGRSNIVPADTGVGIPGYLTQADLLQSIAPVITARSDTFTIRAYGDARDNSGNVVARAWCEAVVQRVPEFVDASNAPSTALAAVSLVNQTFGRGFNIVSFRYLSPSEVGG